MFVDSKQILICLKHQFVIRDKDKQRILFSNIMITLICLLVANFLLTHTS